MRFIIEKYRYDSVRGFIGHLSNYLWKIIISMKIRYRSDTKEIIYQFSVELYNDNISVNSELIFPKSSEEYISEEEIKKPELFTAEP